MMKTVIIHGQAHKGSTYNIARQVAEKLGGEISEFFLPRDFNGHCVGCNQCFMKSEELCPHRVQLKPIVEKMDEADVIILASPVYVYHVTGAMKDFLDHFGYRWMIHRPESSMFKKVGVCISTAAGGGTRSTNKDMADSMFFWGIGKIMRYGINVYSVTWSAVSEKIKKRIDEDTTELAQSIAAKVGKVRCGIKTKFMFRIMRMIQKRGVNKADNDYWKAQGWLGKGRPWKK